ncbi:MAG: protein-glutamate O-methyltransferase CheR [Myxococcales bacterium]|nr:protein-glutamate O-methyltransferase CheR [Myxococcales bacterium]
MSERPKYFEYIRKLAKERAHLEIGETSNHVVDAGLAHIRRARGFNSVEELIDNVQRDPDSTLAMHVVESMTTNETSFFRDAHLWAALREHLLPALIKLRKTERRLNIWSAATASGQEAFSLAILIRENFPELEDWRVGIIASDISREMITRTRSAIYSEHEMSRGMPERLRERYFHKVDGGYQASDSLRNLIQPQVLNLAQSSLLLPKFDLVLARNVLIYFDVENKKKMLGQMAACMHPWTPLILGAGETTLNVEASFSEMDYGSFRFFSLENRNV